MGINQLKTIVLKQDETATFCITQLMLEGVGYETVWSRQDNLDGIVHRGLVTRDRERADLIFDQQLRQLWIIEAKLALGLPDTEPSTMKGE